MSSLSSHRSPPRPGRNSRKHGTCSHQWIGDDPCIRCGMVRGGRRPIRERKKIHVRGRDRFKGLETATPECVAPPLRRSLLERFVGLFKRKEKRA